MSHRSGKKIRKGTYDQGFPQRTKKKTIRKPGGDQKI